MTEYSRLPRHIGIIPDGNRRWAIDRGMDKEEGYDFGMEKGKDLFQVLYDLGVDEVTVYAFTKDNTKRKSHITIAYTRAVVDFVQWVRSKNVSVLAVGDDKSDLFPDELKYHIEPRPDRGIKQKINFLVNYSWQWDIAQAAEHYRRQYTGIPFDYRDHAPSRHISRIDLLIRWGGQNRLSGFPPLQTVYSDIYIVKRMFPDFNPDQLHAALEWYQTVDVTLGG